MKVLPLFFLLALFPAHLPAAPRFKAVAFDLFALFSTGSIGRLAEKEFPGKGQELVRIWRSKLLEHGFVRTITGNHRDYFLVLEDALDVSAKILQLKLSDSSRRSLVQAWLNLEPFPDTADNLRALQKAGVKIITIANFPKRMLVSNAKKAGVEKYFHELLSTEDQKTLKPDPRAYAVGAKRLGLKKDEILYVAFGTWDIHGARSFGYPVYWINRAGFPGEYEAGEIAGEAAELTKLVQFVLGESK